MRVWGNLDWENPKGRHSLFHFLSGPSSVVFALYLILLLQSWLLSLDSLFLVERRKSGMSSFDFFDSQRMAHSSRWSYSFLYTAVTYNPVIISRGLHYRPGLKIEEWLGLLPVKGMMVHPRPLQVCLHLLWVPSGFHGLFVLPQLLMVVSFSFPFWIVALFSSRDLISTPTQEKS